LKAIKQAQLHCDTYESFVTITPDDINNPTTFKLSIASVDNMSFLQTTTSDDNHIQQTTSTTINNVAESILEWQTTSIENPNGWVVSTNMTLRNATCRSTNAVFLGNMQQESTCLFYVMKYIPKIRLKSSHV
jgi:hypothetical protein